MVGTVDSNGNQADFSQGQLANGVADVSVHAPGVSIACADLGTGTASRSGTSFCKPHAPY